MATMYILDIESKNLDLIQVLNQGVRPEMEERETVFLCLTVSPIEVTTAIMFKDDLYDENGHYKFGIFPRGTEWVTLG